MIAALAAALVLAQTPAPEPTADKPVLLVMPLRAEPKLATSARALDELILEAVGGLKRYSVLGPGDINALLGIEAMKDAVGCDDVSCAAEIGGALGAPYLLAGELRALGEQVVLSLRLMDTKKRSVLARSTARGATSADSLNQMMATAVGACFKTTIEANPAETTATEAAGAYMAFLTEVSGYISRNEYSSLLGHMPELSARAKKVKAPAGGQSAEELLTYYQALACFTLKRDCFKPAATRYHKEWPNGAYGSGIDTYATMLDDQKTAQRDHHDEVLAKVADIRAKVQAGTYDQALGEELIAVTYYGGQDYEEAARLYALRLNRLYAEAPPKVDAIMSTTQQAVFSWQQIGNLDAARAALKRAETLDAKAYRTSGLQQTERSLPK